MIWKRLWQNKYFFALGGGVLVVDLATKYFFANMSHRSWEFFGISFRYAFNTGSAFSLPVPMIISAILGIGIVVVLIFLWNKYKYGQKIAFTLIMAGALGNTFNRLWNGGVVDFIEVPFFAVFNVADMALSVGIGIFIWAEWQMRKL